MCRPITRMSLICRLALALLLFTTRRSMRQARRSSTSTYLGGGNIDQGTGIAADAAGNAYVTGITRSTDFPTANAIDNVLSGFDGAFVAKLNAASSARI